SWKAIRYLIGLAACVLALLVLATIGYGDLSSPLALHKTWLGVVYAALGIGAGLCLGAYLRQRSIGDYPFRLGRYLFPVGVIEVEPKQLTIVSLSDLSQIQRVDAKRFRLTLGRRQFTFSMPAARTFEELRTELEEYRARLVTA